MGASISAILEVPVPIINNLFKVSKSNSTKLIEANYKKNATTYKNPKFTI